MTDKVLNFVSIYCSLHPRRPPCIREYWCKTAPNTPSTINYLPIMLFICDQQLRYNARNDDTYGVSKDSVIGHMTKVITHPRPPWYWFLYGLDCTGPGFFLCIYPLRDCSSFPVCFISCECFNITPEHFRLCNFHELVVLQAKLIDLWGIPKRHWRYHFFVFLYLLDNGIK